MRTCPVCERPIPGCLGHTPGQAVKIFVEQRKALRAQAEAAQETVTEMRDEVRRLRECAKQQAKGPQGSKTLRVEVIPGEGRRFHMVVTFPSAMRAGEVKAANTIASLLGIVIESAKTLPEVKP